MITRKKAEQLLRLVQQRAQFINGNDYAYVVERIEVFGSYLTDKAQLGDLDVMVMLRRKHQHDTAHREALEQRRQLAKAEGRTFSTFVEQLFWPTEEVHRLLKSGNRGISIHDAGEREALAECGATFKTIFPQEPS